MPHNRFWTDWRRLALGIALLLPVLIASGMAAAASPAPEPKAPNEISLNASWDGARIDVAVGQTIEVRLPASPTTGNFWRVDSADSRMLFMTGDPEFVPDSSLLGSPATQVMRFRAIGAGDGTLRLAYGRPWEATKPPERTFSLRVVARDAGSSPEASGLQATQTPSPSNLAPGEVRLVRPGQVASNAPAQGSVSQSGLLGEWATVFSDDFEGTFPGTNWSLFHGDNGYAWGLTNYRSHGGGHSVWCADAQFASNPDLTAPGPYPNSTNSWHVYGPFDLSNATDAKFLFWRWQKTKLGDNLIAAASVDGTHFGGVTFPTSSSGWQQETVSLTSVPTVGNLCGYPRVWIALVFQSNSSGNDEGVYVDDVLVQKVIGSALPSAYDWRALGGVTPIRDQMSCGSCWAFSTVGALESAIAIRSGVLADLSEQYLVSCNVSGYSCAGGWFAHDYHEVGGIVPPGELGPGAVLEAAAPYVALDTPCGAPHAHSYSLQSWNFVDASVSIPSPRAIKEAIYLHGPVSVALYAGSRFGNYTTGVFTQTESGALNHAVVLVGWDDNLGPSGAWILRNSWSSGWGEAGYMRIGYGVNLIGSSANYVVYTECPAVSAPSGPTPANGATGVAPTTGLDWADSANATTYDVYFGTQTDPPYLGASTSSAFALPTLQNSTHYYWKVISRNECGQTTGSVWSFTTAGCAAPAAPSAPQPANGVSGVSRSADLDWADASSATSYDVYFGVELDPPYSGTVASSAFSLPALDYSQTYRWRIVARNACTSTTSAVWQFTTEACISPTTPSAPSPGNGAIGVAQTTVLGWSALNATSFDVYFGAAPNPALLTTTTATTVTAPPLDYSGHYYWQVIARNECGTTPGSAWEFTVVAAPCNDAYEPDGTPAQSASLTVGAPPQSGRRFCTAGDQDWGRFDAVAGGVYTITTSSLGTQCDTVMSLFQPDGVTLLAQNDDYGAGGASRVVWTAPAAGTYYISVTNKPADVFGPETAYSLSVQRGNSVPAVVTLTPDSGTQAPTYLRTMTTRFSDADGFADLARLQLLQNTTLSSTNASLVLYDRAQNKLFLRDSEDLNWIGGFAPGSQVRLSNQDTTLYLANTSVTTSGSTLTVNWGLVPHAASSGRLLHSFLSAEDASAASTGWVDKGIWRVNMFPGTGSVTPSSGSCPAGATQTFSATFTDPDGADQIWRVYLLINDALVTTGGLYARYEPASNRIFLPNDDGSATLSLTPGDNASIENSWARINGLATSVSRSLNTLTVNLNVTFKAMSGPKSVYLYIYDNLVFVDGWNVAGSWTIGSTASAQARPLSSQPLVPDSDGRPITTRDAVPAPEDRQPALPPSAAPKNLPAPASLPASRRLPTHLDAFARLRPLFSWGYAAAALPSVVSVSPSTGTRLTGYPAQFVTRFSDPDGFASIRRVYLKWFSDSALLLNAMYDRTQNKLFLMSRDGNWIGGFAPGSNARISDGWYKLDVARTSVSASGTNLAVTWDITGNAPASGFNCDVFLSAEDASGSTGDVPVGSWRINSVPSTGGATPAVSSVAPESPTTISVTYSDLDGFQNIWKVFLLVNSSISAPNCFYAYYERSTNSFFLRKADNSGWLGPLSPGAGTLDNGYAALNSADSSVSGTEHVLTVHWNITFHPGLAGANNLYAYVYDNQVFVDGWNTLGAVTIGTTSPLPSHPGSPFTPGTDDQVTTGENPSEQ